MRPPDPAGYLPHLPLLSPPSLAIDAQDSPERGFTDGHTQARHGGWHRTTISSFGVDRFFGCLRLSKGEETGEGSAVLALSSTGEGAILRRPYSSNSILYLRRYLSENRPQSLPRAIFLIRCCLKVAFLGLCRAKSDGSWFDGLQENSVRGRCAIMPFRTPTTMRFTMVSRD